MLTIFRRTATEKPVPIVTSIQGELNFFRKKNHSLFKKIANKIAVARELSLRLDSVMRTNQMKQGFRVSPQWREGKCVCGDVGAFLSFHALCRAVRGGPHHLLAMSYFSLLPMPMLVSPSASADLALLWPWARGQGGF